MFGFKKNKMRNKNDTNISLPKAKDIVFNDEADKAQSKNGLIFVSVSFVIGMVFMGIYLNNIVPAPVKSNSGSIAVDYKSISLNNTSKLISDNPFLVGNKNGNKVKDGNLMKPNVKVPSKPRLPGPLGKNRGPTVQGKSVSVIGLLPPDMAVIIVGGKKYNVTAYSSYDFGRIGDITGEGVYIDNNFVRLTVNSGRNTR